MHFDSLRSNPVSLFTLRGGRWSRWLLLAFLPPPDPQQSRWEGGGSCWIACIVSVFSSVQFSRSVVSDSLRLHGPQHARLPCPSPTPGAYSNTCPSSRWYHPTISSSVVLFSSCLQSFPASGSFPMNQLFASGGQRIGASALATVLPMNTQRLTSLRILPPIPNKCWLIKRYIFQSQSVKILPLLIL